jgi:orotate phosphoribosyltransferase
MTEQNTQPDSRTNLINIIMQANAYDSQKKFINIDCIWSNPDYLRSFVSEMISVLQILIPIKEVNAVAAIDNIIYPFGALPIATLLSVELRKPLVIWKENADPITSSSCIYGPTTRESGCLMLNDATQFGITAMKAIASLTGKGWGINWFVTILDAQEGAQEFIEKESAKISTRNIKFLSIFNRHQIEDYLTLPK